MPHTTAIDIRDVERAPVLNLGGLEDIAVMKTEEEQHDRSERWSALAIASLTVGVLSFLLVLFSRVNIYAFAIHVSFSVVAIVMGLFGMKRTRALGLHGYNLAYAGMLCGANSLVFSLVHEFVGVLLTPGGGGRLQ